jgi:CRP/FNR family transcriptional regulator, putaive post-exponential-phase nitrogen-starvation regulator
MDTVEAYVERYALRDILSPDLVGSLKLVEKEPGALLIRAGDPARDLFFFVEGRLKAYSTLENGQSVLAAFYKPFDVLGEAELFSSGSYALSVETLEKTVCLRLPVEAVAAAAERNVRLLTYLCGRLGAKLTDRMIAESINLRYPVENRLASYLMASMDGDGWIVGTDNLGELADFLGASYRQLSRAVAGLRAGGVMDKQRGRIRVLDRKRLEPLARDLYARPGGSEPQGRGAGWAASPPPCAQDAPIPGRGATGSGRCPRRKDA